MDGLIIRPNIKMDSWKNNLNEVAEKLVNNRVKDILLEIKNFECSQHEEFLIFVVDKLKNLLCIELDDNELEVIDLVTEIMEISSTNFLISIKFAKINFKIIANNKESVKSTNFLENYVKILCSMLIKSFDENNATESKKFAKVNLCIIMELQNMFQAEYFLGNKYIIHLFIKLIDADICDLEEQLSGILNKQLETPGFYCEIFSIEEKEIHIDFLRYCLMIVQNIFHHDLIENVMVSGRDSNFICLLISSIAKHFDIMENNPDVYEQLISELVDVIIKAHISETNFDVIEKHLIDGIICDNYSLSVVCFNILCQFIITLDSPKVLKSYFILFQDLLLLMWNPSLEFCENRQLFVAQALKILYKSHENQLCLPIDPRLNKFFNIQDDQSLSDIDDLIINFSKLKNEPTAKNYYNLIENLNSVTEVQSNEKSSKDLNELIQLIGCSDWNVFSTIVIKIIDLITMTQSHEKKMLYLLKFNPINGMKKHETEMPLEIVYKLLKMFLSFMSKAGECDGLKNYIKKSLDKLLDMDVSVRRLYLNSKSSKTVMIKEEDTLINNIGNLLKTSVNFNHACKEPLTVHKEQTQLENLEKMLIYSKWISNQDLSNEECEIVNKIILNLQRISSNDSNESV